MADQQSSGDNNHLSTPQKEVYFHSPVGSPSGNHLTLPSPIITRRTRTLSTSDRAMRNPVVSGKIKSFSRTKGHGFIQPKEEGAEDIFVHISDIEGEYIPLSGDEVSYRICAIPPKYEKYQAIHVIITNLTPHVHHRWETPISDDEANN